MEIKTIEELNSLKSGQQFNFHCIKCGANVVVNHLDRSRLNRYTQFICKRCKIIESAHKNRYFGDVGLSKNNPIETNNDPDILDKMTSNCWYRYKCENCGKEVVAEFKRFRLESNKRFLCGKCKFDNTMLERFGVTRALKNDALIAKMRNTNIERYGKPDYMTFGSKEHEIVMLDKHGDPKYCNRDKINETLIDRYGGKSSFCSEEIKAKSKKTLVKKYGVENVFFLDEYQEKRRKTMNARYGVDYTAESSELKEKMQETCLKLYGRKTGFSKGAYTVKYNYQNVNFDSIPELCVYIFCINHWIPIIRNLTAKFEYTDTKGKSRCVHPDFIINSQYVEIKGAHFFKDDGTMYLPYRKSDWNDEEYEYQSSIYESKRQCLIKNNVLILKDTDPWVQNCINWVKLYLTNSFILGFKKDYVKNMSYGYTPFNIDQTKEYQDPIGPGVTPFDI